MPELGEPVAVGVVSEWEGECPFTHETTDHKIKNKLDKSSGTLGSSLNKGVSTRLWEEKGGAYEQKEDQKAAKESKAKCCGWPPSSYVTVESLTPGVTMQAPFSPAAHHLIPTNASFLPCSSLMAFVAESKGDKILGEIGYDVNGAENGIWLPTHTALVNGMADGTYPVPGASTGDYGALPKPFKQRYAEAVMKHTSRQFHTTHRSYSSWVKGVLEKITLKMLAMKEVGKCEKCKKIVKDLKGKRKPPHTLSLRIDSLSMRVRKYLYGSAVSWRAPLFTSSYAAKYAESVRAGRA